MYGSCNCVSEGQADPSFSLRSGQDLADMFFSLHCDRGPESIFIFLSSDSEYTEDAPTLHAGQSHLASLWSCC